MIMIIIVNLFLKKKVNSSINHRVFSTEIAPPSLYKLSFLAPQRISCNKARHNEYMRYNLFNNNPSDHCLSYAYTARHI